MSELKIYRASAGSGKTYTLTQDYIHLLFEDPTNFKRIMAVTFTNKATAEMRSRILSALNDIAKDSHPYTKGLQEKFSLSEEEVKKTAALLLRQLLHNYSDFSVKTIDSFFQTITRSFAREMGLSTVFRLEFESKRILQQAIDQLILEMNDPQHKAIKEWLTQYAFERMEADRGWNISNELFKIGKEIFSEKYQADALSKASQIHGKTILSDYKKKLEKIIEEIDSKMKSFGDKGLEIIKTHNLNINTDFKGKSRSPVKHFERLSKLNDHMNLSRFSILLEGIDNWINKNANEATNNAIERAFKSGLYELLIKAENIITTEGKNYQTAKLILPNLNALGILNDVYDKMMQLSEEQNIFLISGTNYLLTQIIDNNESPFIYEKVGTRYQHFMIDEFQDTSALQYSNFLPLISDSLASGGNSLLIGDIKQAIYRWRNSDWNLLAERVDLDFDSFGVETPNPLDTNYRSNEEIILFNNLFFHDAASRLQLRFNEQIPEELQSDENIIAMQTKIKNAYNDTEQKTPENAKASGGRLHLQFLEGKKVEDFQNNSLRSCIQHIDDLTKSYTLGEICILVRKNSEAVLITEALLSGEFHPKGRKFPVISNESLLLSKSEIICLIIAHLRLIQNPEDAITAAYIRQAIYKIKNSKDKNQDISSSYFDIAGAFNSESITEWEAYKGEVFLLQDKPLYELTEAIINLLPESQQKENSVYIQAFLSLVLNFINRESSGLNQFLEYWDQTGRLQSLSVPENQEAIKVMTIHKAKGLEFPAVVIPFASWRINTLTHEEFLWFKPQTPPFNEISLLPVRGVKALSNSWFALDYFNEILHQYVDNLNITYVAFTRAGSSLSVFAHLPRPDYKEITTVAHLLHKFTFSESFKEKYINSWDNNNKLFSFSLPDESERKQSKKSSLPKSSYRESRILETLAWERTLPEQGLIIHPESENYFTEDEGAQRINYGRIMHRLFEQVAEIKDLDQALKIMQFNGLIDGSEIQKIKLQFEEQLKNPKIKSWFDGSYEIKTEATILSPQAKRPDRVMISENEIVVLDYKFGQQKLPSHYSQVKEYMKLLKKMGYKNIKGFIWYFELNELTEVENK